MKKINKLILSLLIAGIGVFPVYAETYNDEPPSYYCSQGQTLYQNGQFSSAIKEFKKALRENPNDTSAKIGLINSYVARAEYYNNTEKAPNKAVFDLKSALFYFVCYNGMTDKTNYSNAYNSASENLTVLENSLKSDTTPDGLVKSAKYLRVKGEFAAAGYDFYRAAENPKTLFSANVGLGDMLNVLGNPSKAIEYYLKAQSSDPDNTDLQLKLARVYEATNQSEIAAEHYNNALKNSDERDEILNSLETICRQRAEKNPSDAEAHCNLGVIYQKQGKYNLALTEYQKAEKLNPASVTIKNNMGLLYFEQKNYKSSIETYNGTLLIDPKNIAARIQKGKCYAAVNMSDKAEEEFLNALKYDPKNKEVQTCLTELYSKTLTPDEVIEKLAQKTQISGDVYSKLAYNLHQKGDLDNALKYYQKALSLNKNDKSLYLNIAQIYSSKNNFTEAMKYSKEAIAMFPNDKQANDLYSDICLRQTGYLYKEAAKLRDSGKYTEALAAYNKISKQGYETYVGIAGVYQLMKDYPNAAEYYEKALKVKPSDEEVSVALAGIYLQDNRNSQAETILKNVLQKNPNNSKAKEFLTYISKNNEETALKAASQKIEAKDYKTAEMMLTNIIKTNSNSFMAHYYRAMTYDALENYNAAVSDYETAIKLEPSTALIYYSLGVDYDVLKNSAKAIANFSKYLELTKETNEYTNYAKQRLNQLKGAK